jgi:hypothetical protein
MDEKIDMGSRSTQVSVLSPDADSGLDIKQTIAESVAKQARAYTNQILRYLFLVVLGAIVASVWNLNGQIYQAVGATSISTKTLELEISRLTKEVDKLERQLKTQDCLEDRKVTDKAGCYRGN